MADVKPEPNTLLPNPQDPEITAMGKLNEVLSSLDTSVQQRVLRWAGERFGVPLSEERKSALLDRPSVGHRSIDNAGSELGLFGDVASLFETANPKTDPDKALVVGYWFQVIKSQQDWDGLSINKELKQLGHGASNIAVSLRRLIDQKPGLAMQTKRSGNSKQSRKKYKLTTQGIKRVKQMLGGSAAAGDDEALQD